MAFPELLAQVVEEDGSVSGFQFMDDVELISDDIVDQGRWYTYYTAVVKHDGRFWAVNYSQGSTEYQDDDGEYTVYEVEPVEVTITQYKRKG
jgi:hypothetical protein